MDAFLAGLIIGLVVGWFAGIVTTIYMAVKKRPASKKWG